MNLDFPRPSLSEPTRKQFWLAAFHAALHRVPAEVAIDEANRSLELCDERWRQTDQELVGTVAYRHAYPVGQVFADDAERRRAKAKEKTRASTATSPRQREASIEQRRTKLSLVSESNDSNEPTHAGTASYVSVKKGD
ncbi:MAG: hypothetical protein ABIQ70_06745 [Dokdonella sp.]